MFQINIEVQDGLSYPIFPIPIGNAKNTGEVEYDLKSPMVAYHQNASNSSWLRSLAYEFTLSGEIMLQGLLWW